jgi:hypothetical protein
MTEAFEIGISLALADGVSEGIAKAQRDADAVTRTVGAGALSVQRLQKAGVAALTIMHSVRGLAGSVNPAELAQGKAAPAPVTGSAVQGEDGTAPLERAPLPAAAPLVQRSALVIVPQAGGLVSAGASSADGTLHAPEERMEVIHAFRLDGAPVPVRQQPAVPAMDQPGQARAEPETSSAAPLREQAIVGSTGQAEQAGAAPPGPVAAPMARAIGGATDGGCSGTSAISRRPGVRRLGLRLDLHGGQRPDASSVAAVEAAGGGSPPPAADVPSASAMMQSAPVATGMIDVPQPRSAAQDSPARGSAAVPEAAEGSGSGSAGGPGGPTEGDVFLDGTLVGRWMSRHLSREAGRASVGPTGFDQRRNALLPGATVGG